MSILRGKSITFLFVILSLVLTCASAQAAPIPAGSTVEGKTLGEWSAEWWQWALSYPSANNPLLDTTGSSASLGDVGSVFFLAGTFSPTPVTRTFAVPGNKFIFFPLLNGFLSEEGTVEEMRARLATFVENTTELHARRSGYSGARALLSPRVVTGFRYTTRTGQHLWRPGSRLHALCFRWVLADARAPGSRPSHH
jgi:hypothetical protein